MAIKYSMGNIAQFYFNIQYGSRTNVGVSLDRHLGRAPALGLRTAPGQLDMGIIRNLNHYINLIILYYYR